MSEKFIFDQKHLHEETQYHYDVLMSEKYQDILQMIHKAAGEGHFTIVFPRDKIPIECIDWLDDKGFDIYADESQEEDSDYDWEPYDYQNIYHTNLVKVVW